MTMAHAIHARMFGSVPPQDGTTQVKEAIKSILVLRYNLNSKGCVIPSLKNQEIAPSLC